MNPQFITFLLCGAFVLVVYLAFEVLVFRLACRLARVDQPTAGRTLGMTFAVMLAVFVAEGLLAAAVIPLAPGIIITDLATGALFLNAALAYVLVALIMAGWGPNGAYAMIGGWRFLGQFIAYAMLIVMPITAVAMR
ncbi:MAG: NADH-quinone oxidoreductase subunit H, partial [Gemmataceae bacterium]